MSLFLDLLGRGLEWVGATAIMAVFLVWYTLVIIIVRTIQFGAALLGITIPHEVHL